MTHSTSPPEPGSHSEPGSHPEPGDDFVRLNDLLDGRLDDAEADALRARIDTEPALREMWDELKRMQDCVRSYGPTGEALEPPADFVAQVRTRIDATSDAPGAADVPAGMASPSAAPRSSPPRGRMLRMLTVAYAAAALLVVGFTINYAFNRPGDEAGHTVETADTPEQRYEIEDLAAREKKRDGTLDASRPAESAPAEGLASGRRTAARDKSKAGADGGDKKPPVGGVFRGPGGHVPPGMREPSDAPPPAPPAGRAPSAPGESPVPTPAPSPDPAVTAEAETAADREEDDAEEARRKPSKDAGKMPAPKTLDRRAGEILLVYLAEDTPSARAEIEALLAGARFEQKEAADPTPPAPTTPAPPSAPGAVPSDPPSGPARKAPLQQPESRLYRAAPGDPRLVAFLRRLESGEADEPALGGGGGAAAAGRDDRTAGKSVVKTVDAATWRRLSKLIGGRTWPPRVHGGKKAERPKPKDEGEAASKEAGSKAGAEPARSGGARARGKAAEAPVRVRVVIVPPDPGAAASSGEK